MIGHDGRLEWQIVGRAFCGWLLCWWEGSRSTASGRERACLRRADTGLRNLSAHDVVGTDIVKPTAIIFAGIDVELDGQIISLLDVELLDAVFAEHIKQTTLRILAWHLEHILLSHPLIARAGRYTATRFHDGNNFTC